MSFLRIITCCLSLVSFSSLIYGQFLIYKRWPNDQIPYEIDDSLSKLTKIYGYSNLDTCFSFFLILKMNFLQFSAHCEVGEAFTEFSKKTGVRFSPKTNERDFIYLFRSDSCYSSPILSLRNLTTESNGSSNEIIINWGAILSGV